MELILKVKALIEAYRDGDWQTAGKLTLSVLMMIMDSLSSPPLSSASFATPEKSADELIEELSECCTSHASDASGDALVTLLLPLLLSLLQKLLTK